MLMVGRATATTAAYLNFLGLRQFSSVIHFIVLTRSCRLPIILVYLLDCSDMLGYESMRRAFRMGFSFSSTDDSFCLQTMKPGCLCFLTPFL